MGEADLTWGGKYANKYASLGEAGRELQAFVYQKLPAIELSSVAFTIISWLENQEKIL